MADVAGGLGPFLSTWLAESHWSPDQIGYVITLGSVIFMLCSAPAGALLDLWPRPRLFLGCGSIAIVLGTLALLPFRSAMPVLLAQAVVSVGGALGAPAISALTLGMVGKKRFPRQQGTNESANHAGNVAAAAASGLLAYKLGALAPFLVISATATAAMIAMLAIPSDSIDETRILGRNRKGDNKREASTINTLLRDKSLLRLSLAICLFHFGNAAVLPLLGQQLTANHAGDPTRWMSICVIVSQLVMAPVAYFSGRLADRVGRRCMLLVACIVLPIRGVMAAFASDVYWLIPIEIMDGIGAGLLSVAAPAAIADVTYGGGRTQTAIGGVAALQAVATAISSSIGGILVTQLGWSAAFLILSAPPLISVAILLNLRLQDDPDEEDDNIAAASSARV